MIAQPSKFEKQIRAAAGIYKTPIDASLRNVGPDAVLGAVDQLLQKYPGDEQLLAAQSHLAEEIRKKNEGSRLPFRPEL